MPLPGKPLAPPLPPGQYRVKHGDTLTKIAKTHGTTIAELKGLNSFDDKRANSLISGEIIKVPSQPNAVNEGRSKTPFVMGKFPLKK
ncbi:MAG: LysM peptidoglycan-binding domain-containing protein [Kiritimatiellae bacterium]|nr:LysM peptidoglycan-binding domain-containing protein [Kiritimatiellia bacterium]